MIGYNPSYLTDNKTLLEEFLKIRKYLEENPIYKIYQTSDNFTTGTTEYALNNVVVPTGDVVGIGDVILFSNAFYGVVIDVSETTFTIATGVSFKGEQGAQGVQGLTGETGPTGADGKNALEYLGAVVQIEYDGDEFDEALIFNNSDFNRTPTIGDGFLFMYHLNESNLSYIVNGRVTAVGTDTCQVTIMYEARQEVTGPTGAQGETGATGEMGADGLSIYLYDGELSSSVTSVTLAQINIPSGRRLAVGDILFSSLENTYGAMSIVTDVSGTVDFIGTLTGSGSGGGVTDVQVNGTSVVADGVANITGLVPSSGTKTIKGKTVFGTENDTAVIIPSGGSYLEVFNRYQQAELNITSYTRGTFLTFKSPIQTALGKVGIIVDDSQSSYVTTYYLDAQYPGNASRHILYAPETWSTGTSGSVTLSASGLYEMKVALSNGNFTTTINWDGSTTSYSASCSLPDVDSQSIKHYYFEISATGIVSVYSMDNTGSATVDTSLTISYRKIGIA